MNFYDLKKARIEEALLMAHDRRSLYRYDWLIDWLIIFVYSDAKWSVMRNHIPRSTSRKIPGQPDGMSMDDPIGVEQICPAFPKQ